MTKIVEIIKIDAQRNGSGGTPFITALVDLDMDGDVRRLSISFAYTLNSNGMADGYAKDDDGCIICFVLDVEGMFDEDLSRHYRGDSIIHAHAMELINEYHDRMRTKYNY